MNLLKDILENYQDELLMTIDGYDNAVIGIDINSMRLIYSKAKIIQIMMEEEVEILDALEYFDFNILSTYVDEHSPIICIDKLY